jgi:hypothetical protein
MSNVMSDERKKELVRSCRHSSRLSDYEMLQLLDENTALARERDELRAVVEKP